MTGGAVQVGKRAAYRVYTPSGVAWLGEVPEHWPPIRLRYRAKINPTRSELNGTPGDLDVSFVPMESVHEHGGLTLDQTRPLAEVAAGYTYFREGDVLAAKITPCFENGKGSIAEGLVNGIGFGTTELHVLRPCPDLDRRFLFYVTISHAFRRFGAAEMYGAGGQKRVPDDFIRDFRQPIPSRAEQKAIAAFLDRKTARIDALIEKKRRQIELLQEKRSALISHAVTKGLNPHAPMKESCIEWLGLVPESWQMCRLKHYVDLLPGYAFSSNGFVDQPDDVRLLRGINVAPGRVDWSDTVRWACTDTDAYGRYRLKVGDIVFGMDRPWIGSGIRVAQVTGEDVPSLLLQRVARLRSKEGMIQGYVLAILRSQAFYNYFAPILTGVSVPHISPDQILNCVVPRPPLSEQRELVAAVERESASIKVMIRKLELSIAKLGEFRTALISAAVTGKIDVRGEVANV